MSRKLVLLAVVALAGCSMSVRREPSACDGMEAFGQSPAFPVLVSGDPVIDDEMDAFAGVFVRVDYGAALVVSVVPGDGVGCAPVVDADGRGLSAASWFSLSVGSDASEATVVEAIGECVLRVSGVEPGCEGEAVALATR